MTVEGGGEETEGGRGRQREGKRERERETETETEVSHSTSPGPVTQHRPLLHCCVPLMPAARQTSTWTDTCWLFLHLNILARGRQWRQRQIDC